MPQQILSPGYYYCDGYKYITRAVPPVPNIKAGPDLTNADETISVLNGYQYTIPANSRTATHITTLSTTGIIGISEDLEHTFIIICYDVSGHIKTFNNGGTGGPGPLASFNNTKPFAISFTFDGSDFEQGIYFELES